MIPKRARKIILKDGTAFQLVDHFIVKKKYFIFVVTVRFQLSVLCVMVLKKETLKFFV